MFDRLIAREGGAKVVNDPADPGGLTKFGISQKAFPSLDIRNLTYDQAKELYKKIYFEAPALYKLPADIQEMVFDFAVHSGPVEAIQRLQKLVGVQQDGRVGPITVSAVGKLHGPDLKFAYQRERIAFLIRQCQANPKKLKFLLGWIMRVLSLD